MNSHPRSLGLQGLKPSVSWSFDVAAEAVPAQKTGGRYNNFRKDGVVEASPSRDFRDGEGTGFQFASPAKSRWVSNSMAGRKSARTLEAV